MVLKNDSSNIILTSVNSLFNWGRKSSLWPMLYGIACCAIEMATIATGRYDQDRFGMLFRASPRQADLMIVAGPVTKKMVPVIRRLYEQMPEPKYVMAIGSCAITGGFFKDSYNVLNGADKVVPVDVFVPGCPPRPEAILHGITLLRDQISGKVEVKAKK